MTLQDLGNIGEFVGAIGVVATLVYLAIQVRHGSALLEANNAAMEENARLARARRWKLVADPDADGGTELPIREASVVGGPRLAAHGEPVVLAQSEIR